MQTAVSVPGGPFCPPALFLPRLPSRDPHCVVTELIGVVTEGMVHRANVCHSGGLWDSAGNSADSSGGVSLRELLAGG